MRPNTTIQPTPSSLAATCGNHHWPGFLASGSVGTCGRSRLGSLGVARAVKRARIVLEVVTEDYSGHSLRAGLVTVAAMAGVSERVIMQQTGHKNTAMLRRYIREGSLFRENAAAAVGL